MFLAEPQPTPWDLHFRILGIPVRISAWFWLGNVLLGWSFAVSVSRGTNGQLSTGAALLLWTLAVVISVLVHELGHALTFRYFGIPAHVVLYHFGGLAVPESGFNRFGRDRDDPRRQILISLAGPAAEFVLGVIVIGVVLFAGYGIENPLPFIHQLDFLENGKSLAEISLSLWIFMYAFIFVSIAWALMNLLPVYPLDGGQISRELFTLSNPREGIRFSLILSIIAGVAVAIWFWKEGEQLAALMFGMLAYSSYATLQAYIGSGPNFRGGLR